jgi:hypothetical protein
VNYRDNFYKTFDLIRTCFELKEAYYRKLHPGKSAPEIRTMIYEGIVRRKQDQWKSKKG